MTRFDPDTRARLRAHLMKRGHVLATLLSDLLAGKPAAMRAADLLTARPGMRPEEKVRAALAQVEARRVLLDTDDDRFGRCDHCGLDLGEAALGEMPWADRCAPHAAI